ncbi:MAG: NAD(P) transhydrogenase subunit alpha [Pirellulaceae bacterium]
MVRIKSITIVVILLCGLWVLFSGASSALAQSNETAPAPTVNAMEPPVGSEDLPQESNLGINRHEAVIASITIFILAVFVGFEIITKVPPTLHTPLMSGSNAISGITIVGALLATGTKRMDLAAFLGMLAVIMATLNVVGGFLVTHRMLAMFKKK